MRVGVGACVPAPHLPFRPVPPPSLSTLLFAMVAERRSDPRYQAPAATPESAVGERLADLLMMVPTMGTSLRSCRHR